MGGGHVVAFASKQQKATLKLSFPSSRLVSLWSLRSKMSSPFLFPGPPLDPPYQPLKFLMIRNKLEMLVVSTEGW